MLGYIGMKTGTKKEASVSRVTEDEARLVVFATIADTTWRMFVPVIGLTLVGYVVDRVFETLPVGVFTGLGVGIVLAVALVVQQYRRVTKEG